MRNTLFIIGSFIIFTYLYSCGSSKKGTRSTVEKIEVAEAFKKVYGATQEALAEANNKALKLESIDLAFATTITGTSEVGIKLWVVSGKYSGKKATSKKATFTFSEDKSLLKSDTTDSKIKEFKNYLIAVINSAENIQKIEAFGLTELEVEVEFTVSKTTEFGAEVELSPVTPSLGRSKEKEFVHTMTLKFKKI